MCGKEVVNVVDDVRVDVPSGWVLLMRREASMGWGVEIKAFYGA